MFETIVDALEPYALVLVLISGLIMAGRIQVSDNVIVGVATVFIGAALIVVHIWKQVNLKRNSK